MGKLAGLDLERHSKQLNLNWSRTITWYNSGMEDSIFTKILNGELPSYKVFENDKAYAFLNIHPLTPGHTLVIPKKQVEFIWDLEAEDYRAVMDMVQVVGKQLRETLDTDYVGV